MYLPENATICIRLLEEAGHSCYAVGGCVRDALLGLTPHDYDLCTSAKPEQIKEIFAAYGQIHAGEKHGTIGIIFPGSEVYEITTFRTEGSYQDSRHPDWVKFVSEVEADLARRDFTVNAMAYSPATGLVDPFGGRRDLENKILRAVGDPRQRFSEDALRILRGARFSVTYDLTPDAETAAAMVELAPLMDHLARERVFEELCKLLLHIQPHQLVAFAPILTQVIPELSPCIGFDQRNHHHIYDIYTHISHVVGAVPSSLPLRWAALLHDIGKPETFTTDEAGCGHFYGHADASSRIADSILRRLKAPNELRQQVVTLVAQHMSYAEPDKKMLRRRLSRLGEQTLRQLIALQEADTCSKGVISKKDQAYFLEVRNILEEILSENACLHLKDLAVNGHDLMALGYQGKEIGTILNAMLEAVLNEEVENEKQALLHLLAK